MFETGTGKKQARVWVWRDDRVASVAACRYEVIKASGKGVFSSVVTATDKLRQNSEGINPLVAIKVIRANDTMYKAGKLELQILTKLAEADPENRRHVIRLLRSFEYRHHLCMVRCLCLLVLPAAPPLGGLARIAVVLL